MDLQPLYDWIFHQNADGTALSLKTTGLVLGGLLLAVHLLALARTEEAIRLAKTFPRSRAWGIALMVVAGVWGVFVMSHTDMGEFFDWRRRLQITLPVTVLLMILYVPEFLAVRALGTVLLLAASPVLHAAFLKPQVSRLLLSILAYVWIIAGMYFVGMPYLLRDWIGWLSDKPLRWKLAALGGAAYGAVMLVAAMLWY